MSGRRRSLEIPGLSHGKMPIPMGSRVGNVIYSSGIAGRDPATDSLPPDAESQARLAFQNMRTLLEQGGATLEDVVRVTVFVGSPEARAAVNGPWVECFPDPHSRPARHAQTVELRNGMLLQIEFVAVIAE